MIDRVIDVISRELMLSTDEIRVITDCTRLSEDLKIDSLQAVEISIALEEELDIVINDSDMEDITTIGELASMLEELQ